VSLRAERSGAKQSFSIKIASSQKTLLARTHIFTIKNLVNNVLVARMCAINNIYEYANWDKLN